MPKHLFRNCVQPVASLVKAHECEHILCTLLRTRAGALRTNTPSSTATPTANTPMFSTLFFGQKPLVGSRFSTLSTVPITSTINLNYIII